PVYVVGHKSPDTDSICAAIAYAELKKKLGVDAVPARLGELNAETDFVLKKFGIPVPELMTDATGKKLIIVDHSETTQAPDNFDKAEVVEIVDHHKIGDITTPNPIFFLAMPVGCTCTIIKKLYDYFGIEIPKEIAGIMLSAILSDTVMFKSVTTTDEDKERAKELAKIAGIEDIEAYAMEMFKAKSDIAGKTPRDLIFRDFKDYVMSGKKVGVGQIEIVDLSLLADIKDSIYEEMKKVKEEAQRHSVFLMLTDIMKEATELLVVTDEPAVVEKAFGIPLKEKSVWLEKVMSRKKQVVPPLEKAFAEI
ncbi:MAG TPA: manganese-dependent inorganic pyrophosphatase, partial [Candidatus Desulfofervidus auxilii]|nr:manganese-dependent inorganic pyrophosphatase [Candidatus Desulfofervidus auxilii]